MQQRITRKQTKELTKALILIPGEYSHMITKTHYPQYYNAGTYGWNYDLLVMFGIGFISGYRNQPTAFHNRDITKEYFIRWQKLNRNITNFYELKEKTTELLKEMAEKIILAGETI